MGKRAHKLSELDGASPSWVVPRRRRFLRFMGIGLLLTIILIPLDLWLENSTIAGREFQRTGYRLIQHRLRLSSSADDPLPITVVDISDLEPQLVPGTGSKATPRMELQNMMEIIARQSPSAVGFDIDFSPDENGWIDPVYDPQFLDACLNLKSPGNRRIPVFLGVNRTRTLSPEFWLGHERYEPLAASMIIRRDGETREMITELQVKNYEALPSLATRLAIAYQKQQPRAFWARWGESLGLLESISQTDLHDVHIKEVLIDYASRARLEKEKIPYGQLPSLGATQARQRFFHKMVVIGAAELGKTSDVFSATGEEPTPGPVVIACAANTLVQDGPLFELTWVGSVLINLFLSFVVFMVVGVLWYNHPATKFGLEGGRVVCTLLVAIAAVLVGVMSVRHTRVVWDGFLIALLALAFHHRFDLLVDWVREVLRNKRYRLRQRRSAA